MSALDSCCHTSATYHKFPYIELLQLRPGRCCVEACKHIGGIFASVSGDDTPPGVLFSPTSDIVNLQTTHCVRKVHGVSPNMYNGSRC